jgi:hypothetical protein
MCKEPRVVSRRLATANCVVLLEMQVQATLKRNTSYLPARCNACPSNSAACADVLALESNPHVIVTTSVPYAIDATADFFAGLVLEGYVGIYLPVFFNACRTMSIATLWCLKPLWNDVFLPLMVLLVHTALVLVLVLADLDLAYIWLQHFANAQAVLLAHKQATHQNTHTGRAAVMARPRRRRRPGGHTTAAGDGVPPFLQIPPHIHILLARSPAPYSPFRRRAHSPTAFSGPMARPPPSPPRPPPSHMHAGWMVSATKTPTSSAPSQDSPF